MNVTPRLWIVIAAVCTLTYCMELAHAKTPEPYGSEIKQLQQEAKAAEKAANKELQLRVKECVKQLRREGRQLQAVECAR